jgi:hypothetical protein
VTQVHRLGFRAQSNWQNGVARWPAGRYEVVGVLMDDGHVVRRTAPAVFDLVCRDPTWLRC